MTVNDLGFKVLAGNAGLSNEVKGVYIGDLLSWVMGNAKAGDAWITIQGHLNIIAVASLTGVSCIIVAESAEITEDTLNKANDEDIPVLSTDLDSFEVAKKLIMEFNL